MFEPTALIPNFFHTQLTHAEDARQYWHTTLKPHYVNSGAIRHIPPPPPHARHVSRCFFVEKTSSGWRLVVDLRFVNTFFETQKIKFENLSLLKFANRKLQFGAKIDLSDAYHHLRLHDTLQPFFQFQIDGEFFQCVAIPFGWALAPFVFTKFTRPVITAIRYPRITQEHGYQGALGRLSWVATDYYVQIYLDDILVLTIERNRMHTVIEGILQLLRDLGILFHPAKCELNPRESIEYLGMQLDIPA